NDPADRYATPQSVMQALLPYLHAESPKAELQRHRKSASAIISSSSRSIESIARPRILIVDDDPQMRSLYRHLLTPQDMVVDEVPDAESAARQMMQQPYDLVLLDVNMPGLSGVECLPQLRELAQAEHMKIIMCSGQATADEMSDMLFKGADDYLAK